MDNIYIETLRRCAYIDLHEDNKWYWTWPDGSKASDTAYKTAASAKAQLTRTINREW